VIFDDPDPRETDPHKSRERFFWKTYIYGLLVGVLFLMVVSVVSLVFGRLFSGSLWPMFLADCVLAVGAYLLFLNWNLRPLLFACPGCKAVISSKTPWICCVCKRQNRDTDKYSFVNRCGYDDCRAEPKSYRCHHCNELVFLSKDEDKVNFACSINSKADTDNARTSKVHSRSEELETKVHEVNLARATIIKAQLEATLKKLERELQAEQPATIEAMLQEGQKYVHSRRAVEKAAQLLKSQNEIDCKGNNDELERDNLVVDEWVQNKKANPQ